MSVRRMPPSAQAARRLGHVVLIVVVHLLACSLSIGQPPAVPPSKAGPAIRLPDGTYLLQGKNDPKERIELTAEEWRKLLEQLDQLKKLQGVRKPIAPSKCLLTAKVEKRGDLSVAVVRAVYEFHTTQPQAAVSLGGRHAFPAAVSLDGAKVPVLENAEDGLQVVVETPGPHTLTLDLETPVAADSLKGEVGFEMGLPRAPITKLVLDPFPPGVKRVNLTTRTPDPDPAKPGTSVREPGVEPKQLLARDGGRALGAVDHLEVAWDPPASAAPALDAVRAADWEIVYRITESALETNARLKLQGSAREWKFVAPNGAAVNVERAGTSTMTGPEISPTVARVDNSKTLWKVDFAGGAPADWVFAIESRQVRTKAAETKGRSSYNVGPFAALDVFRQTGSVKLIAGPNNRLVVKAGASLRQAEPPTAPDENETIAFYRLATGPVGSQPPTAPLLDVEARPLTGRVSIRPTYRLELKEAGWRVAIDVRVTPIRNDIDQITLELPPGWPTPDPASQGIDTVQTLKTDSMRTTASVRLAAAHREPFEFTLTTRLPVVDSVRGSASLLLPRFPQAPDGEAQVTVEVPAGMELRGAAHEWDADKPSGWANPLAAVPGADGKPPKSATAIAGKFDQGLAQLDLTWQPHRPELVAEITADVEVQDRQMLIEGELRLRSPDGFSRPIACRGPERVLSVPGLPLPFVLGPQGPAEWELKVPPPGPGKDPTSAVIRFAYVLPFAQRSTAADARVPRMIPVGLFWPIGATRAEATVRVWPESMLGPVAISPIVDDWRVLPPAAAVDRPALPALTLFRSGTDLDLTLNVQPAGDASLAAGQVDRVLVEVSGREPGAPLHRRGLFRVRRWFAPTLDVDVPGLLPAAGWSAFIDGRQASGAQFADGAIRVPLPTLPERAGSFVVEVRYRTAALNAPWAAVQFDPPKIRAAAYTGTTRWLVDLLGDGLPLLGDPLGRVEQKWQWTGGLPHSVATATSADLTRWVREGAELELAATGEALSGAGGESFVHRQESPAAIRVLRVPRLAFLAICSLLVFAGGLLLTRLPGTIAGLAALVLAGLVGAVAVVFPQPAAQAAAAALPGVLALAAVLAIQFGLRWYHQRRVTHLPGFTRVRIEQPTASAAPIVPPAPAPSARNGASKASTGTAAAASPVESGPSGSR